MTSSNNKIREMVAAGMKDDHDEDRMGNLIRLLILIWSGGLLTMYYLGGLGRLDTTFIGGLLTQTLAGFGIRVGQRKKEDSAPVELKNQPTRKAPEVK